MVLGGRPFPLDSPLRMEVRVTPKRRTAKVNHDAQNATSYLSDNHVCRASLTLDDNRQWAKLPAEGVGDRPRPEVTGPFAFS